MGSDPDERVHREVGHVHHGFSRCSMSFLPSRGVRTSGPPRIVRRTPGRLDSRQAGSARWRAGSARPSHPGRSGECAPSARARAAGFFAPGVTGRGCEDGARNPAGGSESIGPGAPPAGSADRRTRTDASPDSGRGSKLVPAWVPKRIGRGTEEGVRALWSALFIFPRRGPQHADQLWTISTQPGEGKDAPRSLSLEPPGGEVSNDATVSTRGRHARVEAQPTAFPPEFKRSGSADRHSRSAFLLAR